MGIIDIAYQSEWLSALLAMLVLFRYFGSRYTMLAVYVVYVVVIDYASRFAMTESPGSGMTNHHFYNVAFVIEVLVFLTASYQFTNRYKSYRNAYILIAALWLIFSISNLWFGQGLYKLNTFSFMLGYLLFIAGAMLHFAEMVREASILKPLLRPGFWLWCAFLLGGVISFAYRAFEGPIQSSSSTLFYITIIVAAIVRYLLFAVGFAVILFFTKMIVPDRI